MVPEKQGLGATPCWASGSSDLATPPALGPLHVTHSPAPPVPPSALGGRTPFSGRFVSRPGIPPPPRPRWCSVRTQPGGRGGPIYLLGHSHFRVSGLCTEMGVPPGFRVALGSLSPSPERWWPGHLGPVLLPPCALQDPGQPGPACAQPPEGRPAPDPAVRVGDECVSRQALRSRLRCCAASSGTQGQGDARTHAGSHQGREGFPEQGRAWLLILFGRADSSGERPTSLRLKCPWGPGPRRPAGPAAGTGPRPAGAWPWRG